MIKVILLILFAELWGTAGQIFYKKSADKIEIPDLHSLRSFLTFAGNTFKVPTIWLGLIFISVGLMIWLTALAQSPLSIAFPIDSMQYILTLIAAHIFLGEKINFHKVMGTLLIVGGIVLVAVS